MRYEDIKDFNQRCDEHPDHREGMISYAMIVCRLHEEIEELRTYIADELRVYKQVIAAKDALLTRNAERIVDLQTHIDNFDGENA